MTVDTIAAAVEVVESRGQWWAQRGTERYGVHIGIIVRKPPKAMRAGASTAIPAEAKCRNTNGSSL